MLSTKLPSNVHPVKGNLLDHHAEYLVHQCNCRTTRAWGLAYSLFNKFPHANTYMVPSHLKDSSVHLKRVPGTYTIHGGHKTGLRGIINIYGQEAPGKASTTETNEQRLIWFKNALLQLAEEPNLKSIAFPYGIGCGLAGGTWTQYENALLDFAALVQDTQVYIVQIPLGKLNRNNAMGKEQLKKKITNESCSKAI